MHAEVVIAGLVGLNSRFLPSSEILILFVFQHPTSVVALYMSEIFFKINCIHITGMLVSYETLINPRS